MANYCTFIPSIGADLFKKLKKDFGYDSAVDLFYLAINPKFIEDYKSTLSLNEEGVPSYESLLNVPYFQKQVDEDVLMSSLQKNYNAVDNTQSNYESELDSAYSFNTTSPYKNKFIAVVEKQPNGNLRTFIKLRNEQTESIFKNQYSSLILNRKLAEIFSPVGITVGKLSAIETDNGRVGVTDFGIAKTLASDFGSIIRVANNIEGFNAISEEFSHLIIGNFIDDVLVQRAINNLKDKPEVLKAILGDDFEDVASFHEANMELVAEEALGHILQDIMISKVSDSTPKLATRALNKIISTFKDYDTAEIESAINEAESIMSSIAKDILDGTKVITKESLVKNHRDVQLNALSNEIDRNLNILKDALKIEQKRYKITSGDIKAETRDVIQDIKEHLLPGADVVYGILSYANSAAAQLNYLQTAFNSFSTLDSKAKFKLLKKAKLYIDSYGQFITNLNKAVGEDIENSTPDETTELLSKTYDTGNGEINISDIIKDLNDLSTNIATTYYRHAKPAFAEFVKPFLHEKIVIPSGNRAGEEITVESLIEEANSDISFLDRWLDSMGESSDLLLQLFDSVVKKAKDDARLKTIKHIQEVQHLRLDAEAKGITDFTWMFEMDNEGNKTGNYISPVNYGQFEKDKKEFFLRLDEEYGINPSGNEAKEKALKAQEWLTNHCISIFGDTIPNPTLYHNNTFDALNDNQKNILERFLAFKSRLESSLPSNRVSKLKAIQKRKKNTQRILDSFKNPSEIFSNIKEDIASSLLDRSDDDSLFGNRSTSLTTFDGKEYLTLPVLYTNRLENPNELTDDVFGSLISYAYMANNYASMDNIIDELETGRTIVEDSEQRKVKQTRGNKEVIEKFNIKGDTFKNFVFKGQSNIVDKLNDFFESQVYNKYLKDEGTFDVFGKQVNIQKLTSKILEHASFVQLGFNWLANIANVNTGVAMQNIEAVAGQYFSVKELFDADKAYSAELKDVLSELTSVNKKSKLALFDALFDIKQDFDAKVKRNQKNNWFERIFGKSWAFIGQEGGDHWLYHRTAIAMAKRKRVLLNGKEMSLWEALRVENAYKDNSEIKKLNYEDIQELDGSPLNVSKFGRQVAHVNHGLFGIYNQDDAMAANRVAMGRLLMQYRKWIKPQMNKRFMAKQYSAVMEDWEEGYYRTVLRLGNDLIRGRVQLATCWDSMDKSERKNVIRAVTEIMQFLVIWGLANWLEWPDDKKRPWALKLLEYNIKRLAHETGGLTPSTVMLQENLKTLEDPIASIGVAKDFLNLFNSCISPEDWTNEIQSGPYKGYSTLEKNIIKAPIPGISTYRKIDKFVGELDTSIGYYMRPSY